MADVQDVTIESANEKVGLRIYLTTLSKKIDDVHTALIGSSISQDGGLVFRVATLEIEMKSAFMQIAEEKMKSKEESFKNKIIWGGGCAIVAALISAAINHFSK